MLYVSDTIFLVFAFITLYFMIFFMLVNFSRDKSAPKEDMLRSISFLIPAHNEEESITTTVRSILETDYPAKLKEIIVIDDGSRDKTASLARKAGAKVYSISNRGKAAALNFGLKKAGGEFVVSVDADSKLTAGCVREAMRYFRDKEVAAVTASILADNRKGLLARLQEFEYIMIGWARKNLEHVEGVFVTPGPMSIYKKNILNKLGGFDEKNLTEDIEIAWRILKNGYKIRMANDAIVYTQVPTQIRYWWRQRTRWNIGGLQTLNKYKMDMFRRPGSFSMFVIPFFVFSLLISVTGLSVGVLLTADWALSTMRYMTTAYGVGADITRNMEFVILPNIFAVFGIGIFILSLIYSKMNFSFYNRKFTQKKDYLVMFIYLAFYISVFPLLLVHSIIKMLMGKREW
ncbi:MAG: glycosyltransferase family 2 protein [Candidatus Aenigmarchaeota archaeon]|nr:glycosyltransferase family 2 protein [Candidatus Aenigmarchaeota archaeon]